MEEFEEYEMNEQDLLDNFTKEELEKLLEIQVLHENYEGAKVVKNAIDQYDSSVSFTFDVDLENDI